MGDKPRVVSVDDISLEASLGNRMLFVVNDDKPGLIGALGQLLGDAKVNIANFNLGRNAAATAAVALIEVDQAVDAGLLTKISALPSVNHAVLLGF